MPIPPSHILIKVGDNENCQRKTKNIKNEKNRRADTTRLSTNEIKSDLLDKSKSSSFLSN